MTRGAASTAALGLVLAAAVSAWADESPAGRCGKVGARGAHGVRLVLSTGCARPGQRVRLRAAGLRARRPVSVGFAGAAGASACPTVRGRLNQPLSIPSLPAGPAHVLVRSRGRRARASFRMLAPALKPVGASGSGRYLVGSDGRPFFWLADTGWTIFQRLTKDEVRLYLDARARQRFTVVQAMGLPEQDGLTTPNRYGDLPLIDQDPARPNPRWWDFVGWIVDEAAARGIRIALLPTWGRYVTGGYEGGPIIFNERNAEQYGAWLGRRFADRVFWVLGGDTYPIWVTGDKRPVFEAMARGVLKGAGRDVLMTYHPTAGLSSSIFFHDRPWLDFNTFQSSHARAGGALSYVQAESDYATQPPKPTVDGEPRYEDHPIDFNSAEGFWGPDAVRFNAYEDLFAGAHGHTYGNHTVWQYYQQGRQPASAFPVKGDDWRQALHAPGAEQLRYVRMLIESRPFLTRVPDQDILVSPAGAGEDHVAATRAADGSYAFVYLPKGGSVTVDLTRISGAAARAWWYDPRNGRAARVRGAATNGPMTFEAPGSGAGNDWVLVLDDAARGFSRPGQTALSADPTPRLRLRVAPRRVVAGRQTRLRFRVTARARPVPGAVVRLSGRCGRANRRGRGWIVLRPRRPGRRAVRASADGMGAARARIRVLRP